MVKLTWDRWKTGCYGSPGEHEDGERWDVLVKATNQPGVA